MPEVDPAYDRYLTELDSGLLFVYSQRSQASRAAFARGRGRLKQNDAQTARLFVTLGRMAQDQRALLPVALAVLRTCNPHASVAEWSAKLFESAFMALSENFDDVERRSGPESYRLSECQRPYTRAERLIVLEVLHSQCDDFIGLGWCADRLAHELGIRERLEQLIGK